MEQRINPLLAEVAFKMGTLREAKNLFSDRLAPDFNIFDYLRTDETGFSRCIASLLDPKGTHGQGNVFLENFLECVGPTAAWAKNTTSCRVFTEKQVNGQRRIDIYLEFPNGVIGIENKPRAGDQYNQLNDYADYLKNTAGTEKKWLLLFLCERDPSANSIAPEKQEALIKNNNFIQCNYSQIIDWLEICACKSKSLNVRIFIEEFAKFIRKNINGELDMSEEKEACSIILKSKENLGAAFDVYKSIDGTKNKLLNKFRNDLETEMESLGFHPIWDENLASNCKKEIGFGIKFHKEQNIYLKFVFEYSGLDRFFWGIGRESKSIQANPDIWAKIHNLMSIQFGNDKKSEDWWPWYSATTNNGLDVDIRDWSKDELPWTMILDNGDNRLAKRISKLAYRVYKAFEGNEKLLAASSSLV